MIILKCCLFKSYPTGNISRVFSELKIGDEMSVRGPKGNFNYTANMCSEIGMIAGGTGITPMLQVKCRFLLYVYINTDLIYILDYPCYCKKP
jgi:NAD(P)H-flavin reductase